MTPDPELAFIELILRYWDRSLTPAEADELEQRLAADPIAREGLRQVHAWYTRLFGEMVAKMKKIDEGGSSLLDNSLLIYTSYMSDGGHGTRNYPVAVVGKAGGALKTGRHIACKEGTPMANLYVETLNLLGVKTDRFGDSHSAEKRVHDGRIPGLV